MAKKDQIKWNKKYQTTPALSEHREPSIKLIDLIKTIKKGKALDIACGTGKNSIFLANNGFNVDAFDISNVAIETINEKKIPNISTKVVDLEGFKPLENNYDLIVMTNYLDRDLISNLLLSLKLHGILFIETYMHHEDNTKPGSNPNFLLQKDELKSFISQDYTILDYDEFDNDIAELYRMKKQSIIVQRENLI